MSFKAGQFRSSSGLMRSHMTTFFEGLNERLLCIVGGLQDIIAHKAECLAEIKTGLRAR